MPKFENDDYSIPIPRWQQAPGSNPLDGTSPVQGLVPLEQQVEAIDHPQHSSATDRFTTENANPNLNPDYTRKFEGGSNEEHTSKSDNIREIFEASSLSYVLQKYDVDPESAFKKFVPQWLTSVSNLGKLLLVVYVNYDNFKDEYGEEEITSLIQDTTAIFQKLGKLVLKLIQTLPQEQQTVLFGNSHEVDRDIQL
jgi:hypothetical protein